MFDKISKFMDEKLSTPMAKLAEQRHLRAIRDGIISTLPIIIVSSMFLVLAFMPNQLPSTWKITMFIKANAGKILLPYRMSMFIMTLYAVFGIGYSLSKSYKLDGLSGGIIAELAYMLTLIPKISPAVNDAVKALSLESQDLNLYISSVPKGWLLPMGQLGAAGLFVGIISAFIGVEIYRFTQVSNFKISMPPEVPASVARSFEALTPTALVILLVSLVTMWLEIDVHGLIGKLVAPLVTGTDSLLAVLFICLLGMFFWSFGIHGWSIVGSLARPLWITLLDANTAAYAQGTSIPHIAAEPFYQWFIVIGGSGCTIGLAILLLLRSRSSYGKALGKTVIIPSIFNINEPIIFGVPIVLNPIFIIPFIFTPMICATIAWIATNLNLVNRVVASAPWTLPGPIGAYLATGGDIRAAILNILLIIVSIVIYYPFFKIYDNKLLKDELKGNNE
ncbi:PTS sugar transporter subunit IIC [Caviibacter abscessus]|uniref:PTS sugar transporter subunit IIC n=1 Tax=Caviibacter abscessus TaxID=1766719 RepID=UPI000832205F|nr:PTS sugar transporter subunit IIC [Caviibacter abscessus]